MTAAVGATSTKPRWMNRAAAAVLVSIFVSLAVLPFWPRLAIVLSLVGFVGIIVVGNRTVAWRARHPAPDV